MKAAKNWPVDLEKDAIKKGDKVALLVAEPSQCNGTPPLGKNRPIPKKLLYL